MNRKNIAATLIEVMVSTAVFSLLAVIVFYVFRQGSKSYLNVAVKTDLQADTIKISKLLKRYIKRSHQNGISISDRVSTLSDGSKVERDALCVIGLDDWNNAANFDSGDGKIIWNRYYLFYGTITNNSTLPITKDDGRFIFVIIPRSTPSKLVNPYDIESDILKPTTDSLTPGAYTNKAILSELLYSFKAIYSDQVQVKAILRKDLPAFKSKNSKPLKVEINLYITPENDL